MMNFGLTRDEAGLLVDALNGIGLAGEFTLVANLWWPVYVDDLDVKWGVDGPALMRRIAEWTPEQRTALIIAVELFWAPGRIPDMDARLRRVGLVE